jgi:hypothetical protein
MSEVIEAIKLVGAVVGLLTGVFVVFDRYMRGRPIASLSFPIENNRPAAKFRVKNVGLHDIAVMDITGLPDVYRLADSMETGNIIRATMGRKQFFTLKPDEERELYLISRIVNNVPVEAVYQRVRFRISWRRCNSTWLPQIPVCIFSDTKTIQKFGLRRSDD